MLIAGRLKSLTRAVRTNATAARAESGKGIVAQLAEIVSLRMGTGKLDPDEYYQYCLYDDRRFSAAAKREFLGRHLENGLIPYLKEEWWIGLAHDKLITYALFDRLGFATPEIHAVHHPTRRFGTVPSLPSPADVAAYLRTVVDRSFVAKPVRGMWGRGIWAVESVDRAADALRLVNGRAVSVDEFVGALGGGGGGARTDGVLFQELLRPHPAIAELAGPRLCSMRLVVIIEDDGPRLLATLWKVAAGASMADNYWEPGNMVTPIDPVTGTVGRPFTGLGSRQQFIDAHPDTGRRIEGFVLPDWDAARTMCLEAAANVPDIPMQAWDIALTSRGPVILELNVNGGMRLPQLVAQRGLYHGAFRDFLNRRGFPR